MSDIAKVNLPSVASISCMRCKEAHPINSIEYMCFTDGNCQKCRAELSGKFADGQGRKHSHYHKDVSQYDTIDVYAVCKIFDVQDTSGCLQHAIKKLLVTGKRVHKDRQTDIQNAIDTLTRLIELESE